MSFAVQAINTLPIFAILLLLRRVKMYEGPAVVLELILFIYFE